MIPLLSARYYAIVKPLKSRFSSTLSRARRIVIFIWIISFLLASPLLYAQTLREVRDEDSGPLYWCQKIWNEKIHEIVYEAGMLVLIVVLPLSVMMFCYCSISKELWKVLSLRESFTASSQIRKSRGARRIREDSEECSKKRIYVGQKKNNLKENNQTKIDNSVKNKCNLNEKLDAKGAREKNIDIKNRLTNPKDHYQNEEQQKNHKKSFLFSNKTKVTNEPSCMTTSKRILAGGCHDNSDDVNTKKQVIKMLIIVVVLYAICWAPVSIDNLLIAFGLVYKLNNGPTKHIRQLIVMMSYANSCVNPVVYAFMSKNFRKSFNSMIMCGKRVGSCCGRNGSEVRWTGERMVEGRGKTSKWSRDISLKEVGIGVRRLKTPASQVIPDLNPPNQPPNTDPPPIHNTPIQPASTQSTSNLSTGTLIVNP